MATITKGAAGLVLTTGTNWVGGAAPGAADIARWASTSGPATGNLTGSLTILGLQIDGGLGDPTHTSGTLTLTQTDAFVNGADAGRAWIASGSVIALGAANRNFKLWRTGGPAILFNTAGALTGTGVLTLINNSGTSSNSVAIIAVNGAHSGFTNAIVLNDYTAMTVWTAVAALTACNITVDGIGCALFSTASNATLGGAGKTLTINNSMSLGAGGLSFIIAPNVALGSVTRTLTVSGNTTMSGTVTGSAGVTVAGASEYIWLELTGIATGFSGPVTVNGGALYNTTSARLSLSSLSIASGGRYVDQRGTADFTWDVSPTGLGSLVIRGNYTGTGVTFPAAPTAGNIASFDGRVAAHATTAAVGQSAKIVISELPGSLGLIGWGSAASPLATAQITYNGVGQTKSTSVVIDSEDSANTAGLTGSTYALLSSGSGPIVLSGTVQRTNSNNGRTPTASARMSLTLGGTNTGDNTLSGNISEVGTNSAILGITKVDAGRWVLSGANSSHTGIHTISAGTLSAQSAKALGSATSAGGVTISGTGTLELSGGITLDKSSTVFTIHANNPITSIGDNTVQTAGITLGGTTTFNVATGNRLAISNTGAITDGANTYGLTKTGAGELALAAFSNTYDGTVTVNAGTLAIGSMGSLGTGNVALTGTLKYTGTGETISRTTQLVGSTASLEAAGSGAVTFSNLTQDTNAKTLTLKGSSTGANTVSTALANNTGALSLAKSDAGKWILTGALSYTGTTAVNDGTLRVQTANSNTTSGTVTIGASGTVELVTDTLASTSASSGEVLGTGNVTVSGGVVKTRGGTTQKGQVRYGGNLTFGAGSTLYIGAAA